MIRDPWKKDPADLVIGMFPGRLGWTKESFPMVLPEGVPDRCPVMVVAVIEGKREIEVVGEAGERWVIGWDVIEFPRNYQFPDSRREYTEWPPPRAGTHRAES